MNGYPLGTHCVPNECYYDEKEVLNLALSEMDKLAPPRHIAIIMDGNGRWAKKRGLPRTAGHAAGAESFRRIANYCRTLGVRYLTVYAFSTENWSRPAEEVAALMKLLRNYMVNCKKRANQNNMCVRVIGDKTRLDKDIQEKIADLEEATKNNTGLHFQIAINYGGRDEIRRAVGKIAEKVKNGELLPEEVTETVIEEHLDTAGLPAPDLLIRTCGEQRISNFLLWQNAYTEFYFTPIAWPDFSKEELEKAVEAYNQRDRKYGGIKEE